MCTRMMRKILVGLCTLPLLVVATAAPAQTTIYDLGFLTCSVDEFQPTGGIASLAPPNLISEHYLWYFALVHHWNSAGVLTNTHWAPWLVYTPPILTSNVGGGWNGFTYVFTAHGFGNVTTSIFLYDVTTQQYLALGPNGEAGAAGPQCPVFTG